MQSDYDINDKEFGLEARMGCSQCVGLEKETQKWVEQDLKSYRRGKQSPTTTMLIQELLRRGVSGLSLLDIGGGIGEIPLELLAKGAEKAVSVEISTAYLNAARQESARQGVAERITYIHGDFVDAAAGVPAADIVTLNKVVCCYPDYEALVAKSAARARKYYALVFPKDWWVIRQVLRLVNWFSKAQKSLYVAYIHPVAEVDRVIRANGLVPVVQRSTLAWHVWVYERNG